MAALPVHAQAHPKEPRGLFKPAIATLLWCAVLFTSAGRLDFIAGWIAVALLLITVGTNTVVVRRRNPILLAERWKRRGDTKRFDKAFFAVYTPMLFAVPLMAGLTVRFGWPALPVWAAVIGVVVTLLGDVPILASMLTNPYLESTVRIQKDRGQRPVTSGPYRYVRHPMYAGIILQQVGAAALLRSAWAFVPVALVIMALVIRTSLEDRTLRIELPGYSKYAMGTRYRLVPRFW